MVPEGSMKTVATAPSIAAWAPKAPKPKPKKT